MKIDWNHLFVFLCVFLILQYVLCISELDSYSDMVSDIQTSKLNYMTIKWIAVVSIGYIIFGAFLYYYMIHPTKLYIEGFVFLSAMYLLWDGALFFLFDRASKHLLILLYDVFIVGGVGMIAAMYILNNYYSILKSYTVPLLCCYIASMCWYLYECYKYNPDLSKLTVAHSLGLTR